jgi:hypothetical protein
MLMKKVKAWAGDFFKNRLLGGFLKKNSVSSQSYCTWLALSSLRWGKDFAQSRLRKFFGPGRPGRRE